MTDGRPVRRPQLANPGLHQERTALAWERTAIATMVAGVLLAKVAAQYHHWLLATLGLTYVASGGLTVIWASRHYNNLHAPITNGAEIVHPTATRLLGLTTISLAVVAVALVLLPPIE